MKTEELRKAIERNKRQRNKFLRIEDGETVSGVILGNPLEHQVHMSPDGSRECEGEGCPECKAESPRTRYSFNFALDTEGGFTVKVLDQSESFTEKLLDALEESPDERYVRIRIKRKGTRFKTEYTITTDRSLTPQEVENLQGLKIYDLNALRNRKEVIVDQPIEDEEVPF